MYFQKLVDEKALGRGWVRVLLKADLEIAGYARCAIERLGLREPYLGRGGWQVASHFLDIEIFAGDVENHFNFLLGPEVVRHMRAGSNYQLTITDVNAAVLGVFPASWRGVPGYSPPIESGSPAGAVAETHMPSTLQASDEDSKDSSLVWGLESKTASGVELDPTPIIPPEVIVETIPEVNMPVVVSPPTMPKTIFKVDCPHGNHKIMSNMVFCPICSKPV